jgi:cell division septation protein DedD
MRGGSNRRRGLGRTILMIFALMVFAVFGAVLWYSYVDVMGIGAGGPPPLIRAEAGPIKHAPDDPGGMSLANRDSPAARILEESVEPIRRERILPRQDLAPPQPEPSPLTAELGTQPPPPPEPSPLSVPPDGEAPLPVPVPDSAEAPVPPAANSNTERPIESPYELPPALDAPEPAPTVLAAIEPEVAIEPLAAHDPPLEPLDPGVTPEGQIPIPAAAPRGGGLSASQSATGAPTGPEPLASQQGPARVATSTAPVRSAPAASPIFRVQLGAFRSDTAANQAWIDLQRRNRSALGELRASVLAAETSSGTFYRLQAGPLTSRDAAAEACGQVKQGGNDCFVVGPLP